MFKFLLRRKDSHTVDQNSELKKIEYVMDAIAFIQKGGNPNAIDENGDTFLHRFPMYTKQLVEYGVSLDNAGMKNKAGYIPLFDGLIIHPDSMLIRATPAHLLNEVYPNGTTIMTNFLHHASDWRIDTFEALLKAGADLKTPNADGETPLGLLSKKSIYLFNYVTPVFENGYDITDMTAERKKKWPSTETEQVPVLFEMIRTAYHDDRVSSLLNILPEVNLTQRDNDGNTLLHAWATEFDKNERHGSKEREKLFHILTDKIDVNSLNDNGETALVSALKMGKYYAEYMCHGSPHGYSTTRGEFGKLLLDKMDAHSVNLADKTGNTALHYAAKAGLDDLVVALVRKGVDVLAKNTEGKTAADMASSDLIGAYLQMVAENTPRRIATQSEQQVTHDNQNTMG